MSVAGPTVCINVLQAAANGVNIQLVNRSGKKYIYDNAFGIQKLENNEWKWLSTLTGETVLINTLGYRLDEYSKSEVITISWASIYGRLVNGLYRISKGLREIDNSHKCIALGEFVISDSTS